jgi:hypothetical protein
MPVQVTAVTVVARRRRQLSDAGRREGGPLQIAVNIDLKGSVI